MLRKLLILMIIAMCLCMCGCNQEYKKAAKQVEDCVAYDLDKYTKPYWENDVVYNESILPLYNENGEIEPIALMYDIGAVVSVKNSSLDKTYKEGTDYVVKDGKLKILPKGNIRIIEYTQMYPDAEYASMNPDNVRIHNTKGYMYFSEGGVFHDMQLAVTYIPKSAWNGPIPENKGTLLPRTLNKLQNGEDITMLVYGDSISVGESSSKFIKAEPYCENYFDMLAKCLMKSYKGTINVRNASDFGATSEWGRVYAKEFAAPKKPDIAIIAFGMNDGSAGVSTALYKQNITQIMEIIKEENPECEFILVAPMLQNEHCSDGVTMPMQAAYIEPLNALEKEGCVVADVTSVHQYLLTRKDYIDMTGNHVNHPNDFLVRLYAQVILKTMSN